MCCICFPEMIPWFIRALIGVAKGCVMAPFSVAYVTTLNALSTLFYVPLDFVKAYQAVATTAYIGRNTKTLALLLLPLPLVMKPLMIIFLSALGGLFLAFTDTVMDAFDEDYCKVVFGGFGGVLESDHTAVRDTLDWNRHSYFSYLEEFRRSRHPSGVPFDIPVIEVFIGLIVACLGIIVCVPAYVVIGAVKCVLGTFYWLCKLWESYFGLLDGADGCCLCQCLSPCFIIAHALIPAAAVLTYLAFCCKAFIDGIGCAAVAHRQASPVAGVRHAFRLVGLFDYLTNEMALGVDAGTCGEACEDFGNAVPRNDQLLLGHDGGVGLNLAPNDPPAAQRMNLDADVEATGDNDAAPPPGSAPSLVRSFSTRAGLDNIRNRLVALDAIWTSFFNAAQSASEDAVSKGWVTREDFATYEPSLFVGVPSLVVIDALLRSRGASGIVLMDGVTEVTDENRPRGFLPDRLFPPMLELRSTLALLDLSEDELAAVKWHAVTCGDARRATEDLAALDPQRRTEIMRVVAGVQSIAIDLSRAPTFHRRFSEVMGDCAHTTRE
jgi:hypothetical protein